MPYAPGPPTSSFHGNDSSTAMTNGASPFTGSKSSFHDPLFGTDSFGFGTCHHDGSVTNCPTTVCSSVAAFWQHGSGGFPLSVTRYPSGVFSRSSARPHVGQAIVSTDMLSV